MFRPRILPASARRRAVILMVVLVLLTLFAVVGLAFVLYANAEADSSTAYKQTDTGSFPLIQPNESNQALLNYMLQELLFDVPDPAGALDANGNFVQTYPDGACSALRGHSLGRNLYGWNGDLIPNGVMVTDPVTGATTPMSQTYPWNGSGQASNIFPFSGPGRLHNAIKLPPPSTWALSSAAYPPTTPAATVDDYWLINYTPYLANLNPAVPFNSNPFGATMVDRFVRDPERTGPYLVAPNLTGNATPAVLGYRSDVPGTNDVTNTISPPGLLQTTGGYLGGWNPAYTYPDGNHVYLGAYNIDISGNLNILARSFYRPQLMPQSPINNPSIPAYKTACPNGTGCYLPLDPNDLNYWSWFSDVNPNLPTEIVPYWLKYTCLRPRNCPPAGSPLPVPIGSMDRNFPLPGLGGDVKNLRGLPGPNDSIWIDLDYPVRTTASGIKYKPLFAFFIMDLDGRVNLNAHGNVRGNGGFHVSNQGWSRAEVNPSLLATAGSPQAAEWPSLFVGNPSFPYVSGKYGPFNPNPVPQPTDGYGGIIAIPGRAPHVYTQVDYEGTDDTGAPGWGGGPTAAWSLPRSGNYFPNFPTGYSNGSQSERTYHPLLFDPIWPRFDTAPPVNGPPNVNRRFPATNMVQLLNASVLGGGITGNCDIAKLLPLNMSNIRTRHQVTTDGFGIDRPALPPWLFDRTSGTLATYGMTSAGQPPNGPAPIFPAMPYPPGNPLYSGKRWQAASGVPGTAPVPPPGMRNSLSTDSDFRNAGQQNLGVPPAPYGVPAPPYTPLSFNPAVDWRSVDAVLGKVDLNRFLPPYPHQGSGTSPATFSSTPLTQTFSTNTSQWVIDPNGRFDNAAMPNYVQVQNQFQAAQKARQDLANDIYRRLLRVTGVPAVATPATPSPGDLATRRWLAQLAVNIVDYIDEDEISTPFNFYGPQDGLPAASVTAPSSYFPLGTPLAGAGSLDQSPLYWVYGTELPRVLVNEVLAEYTQPAPATPITVNVFVELFNPIPTNGNGSQQWQDSLAVPLYVPGAGAAPGYAPYVVMVADNNVGVAGQGSGLAQTPTALSGAPQNANDAVLGTPNIVRAQADFSAFATLLSTVDVPPLTLPPTLSPQPPQGPPPQPSKALPAAPIGGPIVDPTSPVQNPPYVLVGPSASDAQGLLAARPSGIVPSGTLRLINPGLTYTVAGADATNDTTKGVCVLLRRLANPHMPPDSNYLVGGVLNPNYNPYITVDYIGGAVGDGLTPRGVKLNNAATVGQVDLNGDPKGYATTSKLQAYASHPTQVNNNKANSNNPPVQGHFISAPSINGTTITVTLNKNATNFNVGDLVTITGLTPAAYDGSFFVTNTGTDKNGNPTFDFAVSQNVGNPTAAGSARAWPPVTGLGTAAQAFASWGYDNSDAGPNPFPVQNNNLQYDWLMHLDRQLASPMDLVHVSGYQPWELTRRFRSPAGAGAAGGGAVPNGHQVNWFDDTNRLYRLFEMVTTRDRGTGVSVRIPGQMNLNSMHDLTGEPFQALCDAQGANTFTSASAANLWTNLINSRNPSTAGGGGGAVVFGPTDRPFLSLGTGGLASGDPQSVYSSCPLNNPAKTTGIDDTILRSVGGTGSANDPRLFDPSAALGGPPATFWTPPTPTQTELLRKIYASTTTRSNVFAVWCTVGFFRVGNDPVTGLPGDQFRPVKLAEELGAATNTNIRPRFFAIVDRSRMVIASPTDPNLPTTVNNPWGAIGTAPSAAATADPQPNVWRQPTAVQITVWNGTAGPNSIPWSLQPMPPNGSTPGNPVPPGQYLPAQTPGNVLGAVGPQTSSPVNTVIVDMGTPNEETVVLQPVPMFPVLGAGGVPTGLLQPWTPPASAPGGLWIFAEFQKQHLPGATITIPGNPGPQSTFTVNDTTFPGVVAAYGILE
jgi:hypothetical protein